ncbi:transmembrane protein 154 isoform X2 [Rousettus aegyptiacus]|uniref:Transmembrane protein 154 n=1 Tax=Rousettus aegyptiacus TaxID=9407 RepID=A0A7J8BW78_ROUAE|nr:transmembrane protein 154 isoform X2 [Rousettus aegyptiacus]KAF6402716.1 transmembrane protein 154 [Rousettus aegyptiacus]
MKAPGAALVLAVATLLLPAGRWAQGDLDAAEASAYMPPGEEGTDEDTIIISTIAAMTTETLTGNTSSTFFEEEDNQLEFILMVLIPSILLALLLLSVVLIIIKYKRKKAKQVPSSQGSQSVLQTYELGSDNLKVPIFEEDTPSVMEIEMEELDKWMNSMNRNADGECLPTLKEEKESIHSPSDNES